MANLKNTAAVEFSMRNLMLCVFLLMGAISANAETVHLRNGEVLRGALHGVAGSVIQINTRYGILNVPKDTVLTIDFRPEGQVQGASTGVDSRSIPQAQLSAVSGTIDESSAASGGAGGFKLLWDTGGSYDVSGSLGGYDVSIGDDVDSGISVSYEYSSPLSDKAPIWGGVGVNYQLPRGFSESGDVTFQFISGYFVGKVRIDEPYVPSLKAYAVGHVGVGLGLLHNVDERLDASLNGGLYVGGGLELVSKNFGVTILYSVNNGTLSIQDEDFDVKYQKLSLGVGYYF